MKCSHRLSKIILVSVATLFTLSLGNTALGSYTHRASAESIQDEMEAMDKADEPEDRANGNMIAKNAIQEDKDRPHNIINSGDPYRLYRDYTDYISNNGNNRKIINLFKRNIKHNLLVGDYNKKINKKISKAFRFHPTRKMMRRNQQKENKIRHNAWIHRPYCDLYGRPCKPSTSKLAKGITQIESSEPSKLSYKQYLTIRSYGHIKRSDPRYNYTLGAFQLGSHEDDSGIYINKKSLNVYSKNIFNKAYANGFLTNLIYNYDLDKVQDNNTYPKKTLRKGQLFIKLLKRYHYGNKLFKRGFIKGDTYNKYTHKQRRYRNSYQYNVGLKAGRSLAGF